MYRAAIAAAIFGLAAASVAHATTITYPNFNSTSGLTLVGSTTTTGSPGVLRIVSASDQGTTNNSGAAYSTTPILLGTGATFSTRFQFQLSDAGGLDPADGFTFVLAKSPTGLGGGGGGMGYLGVDNSFAIEFDTYNNDYYGGTNYDGNSSNHVAIDTNGQHTAGGQLISTDLTNVYGNGSCGFPYGSPPQNNYAVAGCMANGDIWTALITYDGTANLLNVTLTDPAENGAFQAITNYSIDIASLLDTNTAYVGFTGSFGSGYENEDILDWTFANTATLPPPVTSVPEPGSFGMFGLGLIALGLGACVRRRRITG